MAEIAIPFPLIAFGEVHVASSLAAILIATVPMIIALLATRFDPAERAPGSRLAGLLVGFDRVVALVGIDVAGDRDELIGAGAVLLAAVGYAAGPMWLNRRLGDLDPRATMGASLLVAAVVLTPLAALDPPTEAPPGAALLALLVLGLPCTAAAFVLITRRSQVRILPRCSKERPAKRALLASRPRGQSTASCRNRRVVHSAQLALILRKLLMTS